MPQLLSPAHKMSLKSPKLYSFAGLFAVIGIIAVTASFASSSVVWSSGFETTDTKLTYSDTPDWLYNVTGYTVNVRPEASVRQEAAHTGTKALVYSGTDASPSSSIVYFKSFDVNIPVMSDTKLSYWIKPQNANGRCAGIDLSFTDGSNLRDTAARDYNGVSLHPNACHGNIQVGVWTNVQSDIGKWLAGRTIDRIWIAYDQPPNTGQFRGYLDDIVFSRESALITNPTANEYAAKYWNTAGGVSPAMPTSAPNYTTTAPSLAYKWGLGSPNAAIKSDQFIASYTKTQTFEAGTYNFTVTADDGVRVLIDNVPVINKWLDQAATTYNASRDISAGTHTVTVQYYENIGEASLRFDYVKTIFAAASPPIATSVPTPIPTPAPLPVSSISGNPLFGLPFYNNPAFNPAASQVAAWQTSRPADASQLTKISNTPRALWMGGWSGDIATAANQYVTNAVNSRTIPVIVAYNIPFRDCGNYSAGGAGSSASYLSWVQGLANGINNRKAVVILEPDALGLITCLSSYDQGVRYNMISQATQILKAKGASVYIEASTWLTPTEMAARLNKAGMSRADGFAINVSNFKDTASMTSFGNSLSPLVGNKHFVIDTSRSGQGSNGEWCNPAGRGLGKKPVAFQSGSIDAYLWVKGPGESDGTCNGGPSAGTWWADYALGLAQRSAF